MVIIVTTERRSKFNGAQPRAWKRQVLLASRCLPPFSFTGTHGERAFCVPPEMGTSRSRTALVRTRLHGILGLVEKGKGR